MIVIVKKDSQHRRLRESRPDLGLADGSDWPVDWQLFINTHSGPDAISIQSVHHTLTYHIDSGVPLAPVQPSSSTRHE